MTTNANTDELMTMSLTEILEILDLYHRSNDNLSIVKHFLKQLKYELKNTEIDHELAKTSIKRGGIVALGALAVASIYQTGLNFVYGIEPELTDYLTYVFPSLVLGTGTSIMDYSCHNPQEIEEVLPVATKNFELLNSQIIQEYFDFKENSLITHPNLIAVETISNSKGNTFEVIACAEDSYSSTNENPEIYTGIILPVIKDKQCIGYFFKKANLEDFGLNATYDEHNGITISKELDTYQSKKVVNPRCRVKTQKQNN